MWLQQAESTSQEEDLPRKIERAELDNALRDRIRAWVVKFSKSAIESVMGDLEDLAGIRVGIWLVSRWANKVIGMTDLLRR